MTINDLYLCSISLTCIFGIGVALIIFLRPPY